MKTEHIRTLGKCRDFALGKCESTSESCWFLHDENVEQLLDEEEMIVEEDEETNKFCNESVFQEAKEKTPPDQMSQLIKIITSLALKVENLEKMMR